jgi:hypothetical protein
MGLYESWNKCCSPCNYLIICRRLIAQPRMMDECGAAGGMRIGRKTGSTWRTPASLPLCLRQIPHDLTWKRIAALAMGSRQVFSWAMCRLRPSRHLCYWGDCIGCAGNDFITPASWTDVATYTRQRGDCNGNSDYLIVCGKKTSITSTLTKEFLHWMSRASKYQALSRFSVPQNHGFMLNAAFAD